MREIMINQTLAVLLVVAMLPISTAFAQSEIGPCYNVDQSTVSGAGTCAPGFGPADGLAKQGGDSSTPEHVICCKGLPVSPPMGYFVVIGSTRTGNFGGLTGADSLCLASLNSSPWLGKGNATLSSSNVKAFLCDGSTCNNLVPNKDYTFSRTNLLTVGGKVFTADAQGLPPRDAWNATDEFATSTLKYWSGRNQMDVPSPDNCDGWTSSSNTTHSGYSGYMGVAPTWGSTSFNIACGQLHALICMVHPTP